MKQHNIKLIIKHMSHKRWMFIGYLAIFIESIAPILAAIYQRDMINQVFVQRQYHIFLKVLLLFAIYMFLPKLMFTIRKVIFFHISYQVQRNLSETFLHKIFHVPILELQKEHVGNLLNHIRNNISDIADLSINQIGSEAIKNIVTILVLAFCIVNMNVWMFILVAVLCLFYFVILTKSSEQMKSLETNVRMKKGDASIKMQESISSIRETVAFNQEKWQQDTYSKTFHTYYKAILKQGFFQMRQIIICAPFLYGTKLIVLFFGGIGVMQKRMDLGAFVIAFTFVDQFVSELSLLYEQGNKLRQLQATFGLLDAVWNQKEETFGTKKLDSKINTIHFEHVTFRYEKTKEPILDHVSLDFPIGKKIALVGASGSGKSTIAHLLLREYRPESGNITINGIPIFLYDRSYKEKISMVFQRPYFLPGTILENLILQNSYSKDYVEEICKDMLCHTFISDLTDQYDTYVGENAGILSGGQKQRLAIARAVLKNTELLILDEATSALDTQTEYSLQNKLDHIRKGRTTIIIAHRLSTIQNADMIYMLKNGAIVASGSHQELLLTCKDYQKLYQLQYKKQVQQ